MEGARSDGLEQNLLTQLIVLGQDLKSTNSLAYLRIRELGLHFDNAGTRGYTKCPVPLKFESGVYILFNR